MATGSITVELDDATLAYLAALGKPADVLARLARSAAEGAADSHRETRGATDESLRSEREEADLPDRREPSLSAQRKSTDEDLTGERVLTDRTLVDQREANAQMVSSTLRANDLATEAAVARERAEVSERELRAMGELRELFIGILGHDLRNPLSSIVMASTMLLRRGHLEKEDADTAARIVRAGQRITRMITQLLDLTRARLGGGLAIERKPADLRQICRDVVAEFDAPVQVTVEGDLRGSWDSDRLAQVLSNLVGNALEYRAPETPVTLEARADGAGVAVEVSNQGNPIPPDVLPFIFEPFRRAKQREKSKTGNLGLGLYIAQQIVLAHGGTLDVRSAGRTTSFVVHLPRVAP